MEKIDHHWIRARLDGMPRGSQARLAEHMRISPDRLSKIMKGDRDIQQDEIPLVLSFFKARIVTEDAAAEPLTDQERALLDALRAIPPSRRAVHLSAAISTLQLGHDAEAPEEE